MLQYDLQTHLIIYNLLVYLALNCKAIRKKYRSTNLKRSCDCRKDLVKVLPRVVLWRPKWNY